ncbi:thioesterase family protein [Pseudonocardia spinosispora]|uniref:thioesterase family protein n=1 Tax=Pseudonocardia spinosispora TaxID=103441 RepID=UPI0006868D09|nr:thioesterase family protein [Pseudonocardia spinosispora]
MAEPAPRRIVGPAQHRERVVPEWIDYNGHLSEPYYVLIFGNATTALMDRVGMGPRYRETTGCSLYTVEAHVRYLHEVPPDVSLDVTTVILERDAKRARIWHEMTLDGRTVATEELMTLHVGESGTTAFPRDVGLNLDALAGPWPDAAGRAIRSVAPPPPS